MRCLWRKVETDEACGALQETLSAQIALKVINEQELAELQENFADIDEIKDSEASGWAKKRMCVEDDCNVAIPAYPFMLSIYAPIS